MEDDYVEGEDDEDFYGGGKAALTHRFGNNGGLDNYLLVYHFHLMLK